MSADIELDFRSYARPEWLLMCETEGYCWWLLMLSPPNDRDRGGGAGYEDHARSSLVDGSEAIDVDQVADGGGAWGVYGENAGVIGDSVG